MKRLSFVLLLAGALVPGFVLAQDTAYKALRAVGAKRGEKALSQVTALIGHFGKPQPVDWLVTLDDPVARGGAREIDVVAGQISSERTPVHSVGGGLPPIDLTKLNLDSDGAFQTAEREAKKNQVGFDSVNYKLSVDSASRDPIWTLQLFDYEQRPVGTVRIAAGSGALLSATNWVPGVQEATSHRPPAPPDSEALNDPEPPSTAAPAPPSSEDAHPPRDYSARNDDPRDYRDNNSSSDDSDDHSGGSVGDRANRFGASVVQFGHEVAHKTTRVFQTVGGWFQQKFTGHNTIDPKHGEDEGDNSDEQAPDQDHYNRPVQPSDPYGKPVTPEPAGQ
jgi:hypothetical protein